MVPPHHTRVKSNSAAKEVVQAIAQRVRSDALGCCAATQLLEQLSWLFFLKAFDESETSPRTGSASNSSPISASLTAMHRWSSWASKTSQPDADGAVSSTRKLRRHLRGLHDGPDRAERLTPSIFSTIKKPPNTRRQLRSGRYPGRQAALSATRRTWTSCREISDERLPNQTSLPSPATQASSDTPRHIIAARFRSLNLRLGAQVYDPCFGSGAAFLWMAANEIRRHAGPMGIDEARPVPSTHDLRRELGPLVYLNGTMGLLLHDVHQANLELVNTLEVHSTTWSRTTITGHSRESSIWRKIAPTGADELHDSIWSHGNTVCSTLSWPVLRRAVGPRSLRQGVLFRAGPDAHVRKRLLQEFNLHTDPFRGRPLVPACTHR